MLLLFYQWVGITPFCAHKMIIRNTQPSSLFSIHLFTPRGKTAKWIWRQNWWPISHGSADTGFVMMPPTKPTRVRLPYCSSRLLSSSRCSPNTRRLISSTASNPSLPFLAFWLNRSTLSSSILFFIFCHPLQRAVICASWVKSVFVFGMDGEGL